MFGNRVQSIVREGQFNTIEFEEFRVLADQRVLGLAENADERLPIQIVNRRHQGQSTNELGDQSELDQILGKRLGEEFTRPPVGPTTDVGSKPDSPIAHSPTNQIVKARKGSPDNEQDVGGVDLDEFLVGMLDRLAEAPRQWFLPESSTGLVERPHRTRRG